MPSRIFRIAKSPAACLFKREQSRATSTPTDRRFKWRKLAFDLSGYNKLGLYTDDMQDPENPIIQEALRRLPAIVLDARNFRLIRAVQLDFLESVLPREKWVTYEQDLEYRYMRPYIDEVMAERAEIYNSDCPNYGRDDWPAGEVK